MLAPAEDQTEAAVVSASASERWTTGSRTVWRLALASALLPLVISGVAMALTIGNSYSAWSDWAGMEMRVRDVGHHPVLIGLLSRDEWSHPGPILFYLLAVPYRLTGGSPIGLNLGALLINGAAIVGMAVVARRRGGTPLLLCTLLGCGLLVRTLGPHFVRDPWVCYITVIPFGLMVLLSWSMTCGDTWALPVAMGVASFLAQTHVGYVALAVPLLVWGSLALVWLAVRRKRSGDAVAGPEPGAVARAGVIAVVVGAVLWLPPLVDQRFRSGNLSKILRWFRDGAPHSLVQGYRVVGAQFGWPPEWLTHHRPVWPAFFGETPFLGSAPRPVLLVPLAVAFVVLWRRRASDAWRLVVTVGLGLLVGVVAVARTVGAVADYRLRWTWVVGMLAFVVVGWTAWLVTTRSRRIKRRLVPAALCALGLLGIINSVSAAHARVDPYLRAPSLALAALVPRVERALPDRQGDVIIRALEPSIPAPFPAPPKRCWCAASAYKSGLLLSLERRGIAARVDDNPGDFYGGSRTHHGAPVRAVLTVAVNAEFDSMSAHPGALRLVAYYGDRTRADRARVVPARAVRVAQLDAELKAGKIDAREFFVRLSRLPDPGQAVAVFESPPTSGP